MTPELLNVLRKCDGNHSVHSALCLDPQCWQGEDNPVIKLFGRETERLRAELAELKARQREDNEYRTLCYGYGESGLKNVVPGHRYVYWQKREASK